MKREKPPWQVPWREWAARWRADMGRVTVAIVGLGQIGGSIGMALIKRRLSPRVIGIDTDPKTLRRALARKACHETGTMKSIGEAGLVILAAPARQIIRMAPQVLRWAKPDAIITDVGSTKREIAAAYRGAKRFVPGHPMAGTERAGIDGADPELFRGVPRPGSRECWTSWMLGRRPLVDSMSKLVFALGALPFHVTPAQHDRWVAFTSHLPYVLALILASGRRQMKDGQYLVGGSFRSATRVAAQPPSMGLDILLTNRFNIAREADRMARSLSKVAVLLRKGNEKALRRLIEEGRP